jgi:hypothetical protein
MARQAGVHGGLSLQPRILRDTGRNCHILYRNDWGVYQHGGWLSLVGFSMVLGVFLRAFDTTFQPEADPKSMFFVITFFPTLVESEIDSVELVVSLPLLILTGIVASRLASSKA